MSSCSSPSGCDGKRGEKENMRKVLIALVILAVGLSGLLI